ncbi:hypothetical protein HG531_006888 [Fusarium graminearum]|nr:hypothetical protein HG531_006888 [Fusarium graminearum]
MSDLLVHLINSGSIPISSSRSTLNLFILDPNRESPAERILCPSKLNILQVLEKLLKQRSRLLRTLLDIRRNILLAINTTRDGSNRNKRRSRTSSKNLAKLLEFAILDGALLNLPPVATSKLLDTVAGDTVDDILAIRHRKCHIIPIHLDTNKATGAKLINLLVAHTVEVQRDTVSLVTRLVAPAQHRSVVSTNLCITSSMRRRAVKVFKNQRLDGVRAVVDTGRDDKHRKDVLVWRRKTKLCAGSVELRTNVQSGACVVGWYVLCVESNGSTNGGKKQVFRHGGHGHDFCRVLKTLCVAVGAEDGDCFVVGSTECFEALVGLLAIV